MDKTTGREQSLTVQGASNIEESEVQRMIKEAEEFAETDRLQRERVEKRNRAEALTFQAERLLAGGGVRFRDAVCPRSQTPH